MIGGDTRVAKFFINCLADPAETVAKELVPKLRKIAIEMEAPGSSKSNYVRYLTKVKAYRQILGRLFLGLRKDRFITEQ